MYDMNQSEKQLQETFHALAASAPAGAPPEVGARVKAAFRKYHVRRRRIRVVQWTVFAAVLVLGVSLSVRDFEQRARTNTRSVRVGETSLALDSAVSEKFVPLPTYDPDIPADELLVVRVELPQNELSLLGLPAGLDGSTDRVRADVLMDQDGTPYAIHFVDR